jgi:hypothetical protein
VGSRLYFVFALHFLWSGGDVRKRIYAMAASGRMEYDYNNKRVDHYRSTGSLL